MNDRTLLKITATENCIVFRTITRTHKSSSFYATCDELAELGRRCEVTAHNGSFFAVFHWDVAAGILTIRFAWLSGGTRLTGREEIIRIPYSDLSNFMLRVRRRMAPKHGNACLLSGTRLCPVLFSAIRGGCRSACPEKMCGENCSGS